MLRFTPDASQKADGLNQPSTSIPDRIAVNRYHPLFTAMMEVCNYEDPLKPSVEKSATKRNSFTPA